MVKHGMAGTPEWRAWINMINRCYNSNGGHKSYKFWGGKGIKVCRRWLKGVHGKHPFVCFLDDVGGRPSDLHTLDRYPNANGNYKPGNVRWATRQQQAWNKVGKPRPDLAALNVSRSGIPLSKQHRQRIGAGVRRYLERSV